MHSDTKGGNILRERFARFTTRFIAAVCPAAPLWMRLFLCLCDCPLLSQSPPLQQTGGFMETRVAVMSIIVENPDSVEKLNAMLHEYGPYIIGRMGIPYRQKHISIVSIAMDAPQDTISALAGKLGNLDGVSVKTAYSNVIG